MGTSLIFSANVFIIIIIIFFFLLLQIQDSESSEDEDEEEEEKEPRDVNIPLSDRLKRKLEDDCYNITCKKRVSQWKL